MFDHSIKVPRLYKTASKIAKEVSEGKGSIKQLVFGSNHPNIKPLYALVAQTFQRTEVIENLLKKSKLLTKEPRLDPWLAKILITQLLWGKNRLVGEAKPIKTILAYEQILKAHISDVSSKFEPPERVRKPRYVRVNTLKLTLQEAIEAFQGEGWVLKRYTDANNYSDFLKAITTLGPSEFMTDIHVPDLLIFPPRTEFYKHFLHRSGKIILQDKASCLPVHVLNPQCGSTILDMCASPGMKTTQAAAAIQNNGSIFAVEMNSNRYETLKKIVASSGATCVKLINKDALTLTGRDFPGVEYILVDPSCSGSGLTDRLEVGQQKKDQHQHRLQQLAGFQIKLLRHALTRFPDAKRVVYSTCSIYPEENEDVVRQVLETCTRFKLVSASQFVNNTWLHYGSSVFGDIGNYCLYSKPDIDLTNGFFVAIFERLEEGEINQFLNFQLFPTQKQNRTNLSQADINNENEESYSNEKKERRKGKKGTSKENEDSEKTEVEFCIEIKQEDKVKELKSKRKKKRRENKNVIDNDETLEIQQNNIDTDDDVKVEKKHKIKNDNEENVTQNKVVLKENITVEKPKVKKKKKLKGNQETITNNEESLEYNTVQRNIDIVNDVKTDKKHKIKDDNEENISQNNAVIQENETPEEPKVKKKKKYKRSEENIINDEETLEYTTIQGSVNNDDVKIGKKHKIKNNDEENGTQNKVVAKEDGTAKEPKVKKKKKHKRNEENMTNNEETLEYSYNTVQGSIGNVNDVKIKKKHKMKKKNNEENISQNKAVTKENETVAEPKVMKKKKHSGIGENIINNEETVECNTLQEGIDIVGNVKIEKKHKIKNDNQDGTVEEPKVKKRKKHIEHEENKVINTDETLEYIESQRSIDNINVAVKTKKKHKVNNDLEENIAHNEVVEEQDRKEELNVKRKRKLKENNEENTVNNEKTLEYTRNQESIGNVDEDIKTQKKHKVRNHNEENITRNKMESSIKQQFSKKKRKAVEESMNEADDNENENSIQKKKKKNKDKSDCDNDKYDIINK